MAATAVAQAPVPQSAISAQARAAIADAGHARVMVALRPRTAFSRAGLSPIKALRMAQVEAVADSVLDTLPPGSHALRRRFARGVRRALCGALGLDPADALRSLRGRLRPYGLA